jgi:Holliday junction resolvase
MNSKRKGKVAELEVAHLLQEYGYEARRSVQYCGANGDADVVGLPGVHLEVKRVEKLNIDKAMEQSISDAREGEMPVVVHRKNRGEWEVTMLFKDFMELYGRMEE